MVAILAADVVGYSHLVEMDEAGTLAALKALRREVIDPLLAEHHGRIVKLMGDGALCEYASVVDAVACAVAIQRSMAEREAEVPEGDRVRFRIGVNLGDVVCDEDGDLHGDGINIAVRLENLAELTRAMEEYENLPSFLEHVSLVMDNDADKSGDKVTMMTIHAAKGLEFPIVYLAGWEEGVFPSQRALDEGGTASLEEERRLAYVAITRAREKATIFHAANRRIYGQWTSSIPSRFVGELPKAHISEESSMSGGASLWRANWSEREDPFADVVRGTGRGPGWQRAATPADFPPDLAALGPDNTCEANARPPPGRE